MKRKLNIAADALAVILAIFGVLGLGWTFIMAVIIFHIDVAEVIALIIAILFVFWRAVRYFG